MRFFLTAILTGLMVSAPSIALAGLPPTRSGGQSGSLSTTFDFKAPYNQVTKYSSTGGLIENDYYNILKNPGFEASTYSTNWGVSGGTLAAAATTNIFFSKGATWDSSAASQALNSDLVAVPEGFKANNCEGSIYIKVPSGTATHLFQVTDGTNILASATVVNSTYFTKNTLTFPCPTSGSIGLQITSVAADEPLIAIDEAYLGLARNVGVADLTTEWTSFTPTGSWAGTTSYAGRWRQVGDTRFFQVKVTPGSGPTGSALAITISSVCTIDTNKLASGTGEAELPNSSGSLLDNGSYFGLAKAFYASTTTVGLRATSLANPHNLAQITPTSPITWTTGDTIDVSFSAPCIGLAASQVVMPDAQGWYVDVNIAGANPSLGVAAVSSYTEITNASLTMTPRSGSAAAGIMCSSTNAAATPTTSTSTCSAGSESLGANFNLPRSGTYEVCVYFSHFARADQGESIFSTFQIIETPTNAQTLTLEGGSRITSGLSGMTIASGTQQASYIPNTNCSLFNWSAGNKGVRLMYEQRVTGTPNDSLIVGDADSTGGQQDIRLTVRPVNSQQQAILANSVSTGRTNGDKIGSARLDCDSASTIKSNPQSMVSTISNISSGTCSLVLATGYFSAAPICTVSWDGSGGSSSDFYSVCTSATACDVGGGGAVTTAQINMTCIGPR